VALEGGGLNGLIELRILEFIDCEFWLSYLTIHWPKFRLCQDGIE
jgi:hypothetical protein